MKINSITLLYYISVILFIMSLTQNAFYIDNKDGHLGYLALLLGFYVFMDTGISWLANILIILSWLFRNKKTTLYYSLGALTLGISFLFIDKIITGTHNKYGTITGYDFGYYLWLLSFVVMSIRNILNYKTLQIER